MELNCPKCHVLVRPTDYFCFNCGKNLKPSAPSLASMDILWLYTKSILLPPFGIYWAIKYLKEEDTKAKTVGIIAIILTFASLLISFILLKNFSDEVNKQLNTQLNSINF